MKLAAELDAGQQRPAAPFLRRVDRALARRRLESVAVITDDPSSAAALLVAWRWPNAAVLELLVQPPTDTDPAGDRDASAGPDAPDQVGLPPNLVRQRAATASDTHALLTAFGPFDVILDATPTSPAGLRLDLYRRTFFHLRPPGLYLVQRPGAPGSSEDELLWSFAAKMMGQRLRTKDPLDPRGGRDRFYAAGVQRLVVDEHLMQVTNSFEAMPKMRYHEMDRVLALRPSAGGAVLSERPGLTYASRALVSSNQPELNQQIFDVFDVPPHHLREFDRVVCAPHQVLVQDGVLLPDTFRHQPHPHLGNHYLSDASDLFATYLPRQLAVSEHLEGPFFYLGSEYPRHFGHLMTEQMSRLWGWAEAKQRYPQLKALVSLRPGHDRPGPFEIAVFAAVGIASDDVVGVPGVVSVDKLLAATPMFVNPFYVHPEIAEVWRTVGDGLRSTAAAGPYPERVFVSRRMSYNRTCHNTPELEEAFRRHGFEIVYPEDHSLADQAMIFDRAQVIAGFAGSALFNVAFCTEPKRLIIISSSSYTSRNEYLIASALSHQVDLIWCDPDVPQPERGFDPKAFHSAFTFDFQRDGGYLEDVLQSL